MKRPDYGDATPGDLARALMRPKIKRLKSREASALVGGEAESADTALRQKGPSGPPQPSRDCSRTPGR